MSKLFCRHEYKPTEKSYTTFYSIAEGYYREIYQHYICKKCGKEKSKEITKIHPKIEFDEYKEDGESE